MVLIQSDTLVKTPHEHSLFVKICDFWPHHHEIAYRTLNVRCRSCIHHISPSVTKTMGLTEVFPP